MIPSSEYLVQERQLLRPVVTRSEGALRLGPYHPRHDLGKFDGGTPVKHFRRLGGIAERAQDIAGTRERGVVLDVVAPIEPDLGEGNRHEFLDRMGDARRNDEVLGLCLQ